MAGGQERILRGRIRTVQATKKITRAMELIAASRIVKAQQRVAAAVPYSDQITEVVKDLAAAGGSTASPLLAGRETVSNVAYVVITADRGLCGGYNAGVQRAAEGEIKADVLQGRDYSVIAVGRKAESYFRFRGYKIKATVRRVQRCTQLRRCQRDRPARRRSVRQRRGRPRRAGLHPVHLRRIARGRAASAGAARTRHGRRWRRSTRWRRGRPAADFEYEPDPTTILDALLPKYIEARIYAALLNAAASEHAFRQRAMKSATDNAEELIKNLSRIMNRARQDSITTEIMEIVSGAEALAGDDHGLVIDFEILHDGSPDTPAVLQRGSTMREHMS